MLNINNGLNYTEYISKATDEEREMIETFYSKSPIHSSSSKLNTLTKKDIFVFSMTRCKDAATVIPILMELSKQNTNLNIKFFLKENTEDILKNLTGEVKIPTILTLDSLGNIENKFLEFPTKVIDKIKVNPASKETIVTKFRDNEYFSETLSEILSLLR